MARAHLTDEEYRLVAGVAAREHWDDITRPQTTSRFPRTLAEQQAVMTFVDAMPAPPPAPRGMSPRTARIVMLVIGVVGLVACWIYSPERTALGLIVVGVFSLVGVARRRRGAGAAAVPVGSRGGPLRRPRGTRVLRPF